MHDALGDGVRLRSAGELHVDAAQLSQLALGDDEDEIHYVKGEPRKESPRGIGEEVV